MGLKLQFHVNLEPRNYEGIDFLDIALTEPNFSKFTHLFNFTFSSNNSNLMEYSHCICLHIKIFSKNWKATSEFLQLYRQSHQNDKSSQNLR